jgi:hypothetical protein
MSSKALDKLPGVLRASAEAREDARRDTDTNDTRRNERLKAVIDSLKSNAENYQSVADSRADQPGADAFAAAVLKSALGGLDLTPDWSSQLFDAYRDNVRHPRGSPAFLKALGLE